MSDLRERVLKAIREAIDEGQKDVEDCRRRGSLNPDFNGEAIIEAAEKAFAERTLAQDMGEALVEAYTQLLVLSRYSMDGRELVHPQLLDRLRNVLARATKGDRP